MDVHPQISRIVGYKKTLNITKIIDKYRITVFFPIFSYLFEALLMLTKNAHPSPFPSSDELRSSFLWKLLLGVFFESFFNDGMG